jgi:lysylphosphatidylglycerol synthetase-like protein (DUF2156 family)
VRWRTAVVGGDPVGDPASWGAAIEAFMTAHRGRRVAVLGVGERARPLWSGYGLSAVPIGRDVVLRTDRFGLDGRRLRNLRQAIQRSHNSAVSVEVSREGALAGDVRREVQAVADGAGRGHERGFSMGLGAMFSGNAPDAVLVMARDRAGRVVAVQRYLHAGPRDLSLDVTTRSSNAPNGCDERLVAETVAWGAAHDIDRVSLTFAPFPELFDDRRQFGLRGEVLYWVTHALDPLISVERLYRYLRKYDAFDQRRYVMLRRRQVTVVAAVLLLLEFGA